jgi:hypothetical protein
MFLTVPGAIVDFFLIQGEFVESLIDKATRDFKKTLKPDATQCCSWKNKDCNPLGKRNSQVFFRITHGKAARVVKLSATDHMECRVRKNSKDIACTTNPMRAHKHTASGRLIKSLDSGKCLDVLGFNKKNGANVGMYKCTGGKNQRWKIYKNGTIRSEMNWKCLDVNGALQGGKNGQNVQLWDCHGGLNQRWVYGPNDTIISAAPGGKGYWCLDVKERSKKDKANVHIWQCADGKQGNQSWRSVKK